MKNQEIKIKIRRDISEGDNNPESVLANETEDEKFSLTPAIEANKKKSYIFEKLSALIFYILIFFMPIFVLPLTIAPVASGKAVIFYCGIFLTAFFFILSAIRSGSVKIPKSALLASLGAVVLIWLASALFSGNIYLSLVGKLYDTDTFSMILASSLALFFGAMIFRSEKRAIIFYILLFCSSVAVFLFQFFHVIYGINIIPFNIFPHKISSLIGGWNDFSIFFGLTGVLSLVFLEMAKLGKKKGCLFYIILSMSFLAMMASSFYANWIIFGFFSLFVFIITLSKEHLAEATVFKKIFRPSIFAIVVVLFFVLFNGSAGRLTGALGMSFSEVRPSWQTTMDISKQSLKKGVVLGTGPNTFLYDWLKFKPASINNTAFWNARFVSGSSFLSSSLATTGVLGLVSIIALLIVLLSQYRKVFYGEQSTGDNTIIKASFLGAVYLWTHIVLYTPGIFIFTIAFIFTGLFLASLVNASKMNTVNIDLSRKTKTAFVSMLVAIALLCGSAYAIYFFVQKFLAIKNYSQAISIFEKTGDINKTKEKLTKAVNADKQDEYYRALSELSIVYLGQVIADKSLAEDKAISLFKEWLGFAVSYAQEAVKINPADSANWMQLGRVYESVVPLKIDKAEEAAIGTYVEAFKVSPLDPSPIVASARIAFQVKKIDEARKHIQSALALKPDLTDALFMLSQIEAQAGNLKEAILRAEQSAISSPNNPGILFQLGLFNYQNKTFDNAGLALESAIKISPEYANARYFLGLVYDKQGKRDKAIEQFEAIQKTNPDNQEIKKILSNLINKKSALTETEPPAPEKRKNLPVSENDQVVLKKAGKK